MGTTSTQVAAPKAAAPISPEKSVAIELSFSIGEALISIRNTFPGKSKGGEGEVEEDESQIVKGESLIRMRVNKVHLDFTQSNHDMVAGLTLNAISIEGPSLNSLHLRPCFSE